MGVILKPNPPKESTKIKIMAQWKLENIINYLQYFDIDFTFCLLQIHLYFSSSDMQSQIS